MDITETVQATDRSAWREWLEQHGALKKEIWLVTNVSSPGLSYLEAVEEGLCFGWIDGIAKRMDLENRAQRFTPRRARSHGTELNKERARRLIEQGLMTDAGLVILPDLSLEAFKIAPDILEALQQDPVTWENFCGFQAVYQRIRIGYIEEVRSNPEVFQTRLANFLKKTGQNKQFGGIQ